MAGTCEASRTTPRDEELVAAVRRGDDRAFELLYARYHRRVTSYVFGMVNDYGRAEDLAQEIFIAALRRMRQTDRPIAFKPWIYEIAKNACIDQYRRTRRTDEVPFDADGYDAAQLASGVDTPDAAIDAKQQIEDLCGAFGGLSDAHHQILVMRELEGLSYREIGDRLGLSRPSVESTLFRARRRLGEEYDELVSGERCRSVQALLATGARIGRRDERRVARHVAHCQPCRREALRAGVEVLPAARRRAVAGRVAALLPVPAFLRLRKPSLDNGVAQWSQSVAAVAEPATSWTKAIAATAAVLVAGGAGAVGHKDTPAPVPAKAGPHPAALHGLIAQAAAAQPPRTPHARPPVRLKRPASVPFARNVGRPAARVVPAPKPAAPSKPDGATLTPTGTPDGAAPTPPKAEIPSPPKSRPAGPDLAAAVPVKVGDDSELSVAPGTQEVLDRAQSNLSGVVNDVGELLGPSR